MDILPMLKAIVGITFVRTVIVFFLLLSLSPGLSLGDAGIDIPVSKNRLFNDVEFLTSIDPARNSANPGSLDKAAEYIFNEFEKLGCPVEYQTFQDGDVEFRNVIASFGPKEGQRIVVGAHYDVCGNQPGADDNASAVAGLLEIARMMNELKPQLKLRVDLVAYTNEEPPYFRTIGMGSYVHAQYIKDNNIDLKAMICIEMIGYYSDEKGSQKYPVPALKSLYPDKGNFIAVIGRTGQGGLAGKVKRKMRQAGKIKVVSLNAPASLTGVDFSDHLNYWDLGYNAVMITNTGFYRNNNYHHKSDTIETLDFDRMAEVVKGIYRAVAGLASQ